MNTQDATNLLAPEPDIWRRAMGSFVTGVTLVTSLDGTRPVGTTVNAFSSLSLEPPKLLVCLAQSSRTLGHIRNSGVFCVNILSESQAGLAKEFASSRNERCFDDLDIVVGETGAPALRQAVSAVECRLSGILDGADHMIVIGDGVSVLVQDGPPLLYHRGALGGAGVINRESI